MPIILITNAAHKALVRAAPTIKTEGSAPAGIGIHHLQIDTQCDVMLKDYCTNKNMTQSEAIINLFKENQKHEDFDIRR